MPGLISFLRPGADTGSGRKDPEDYLSKATIEDEKIDEHREDQTFGSLLVDNTTRTTDQARIVMCKEEAVSNFGFHKWPDIIDKEIVRSVSSYSRPGISPRPELWVSTRGSPPAPPSGTTPGSSSGMPSTLAATLSDKNPVAGACSRTTTSGCSTGGAVQISPSTRILPGQSCYQEVRFVR